MLHHLLKLLQCNMLYHPSTVTQPVRLESALKQKLKPADIFSETMIFKVFFDNLPVDDKLQTCEEHKKL